MQGQLCLAQESMTTRCMHTHACFDAAVKNGSGMGIGLSDAEAGTSARCRYAKHT